MNNDKPPYDQSEPSPMAKNKKKEKSIYDKTGGLAFMKNWPEVVRWLSIIPTALIVFFIVRFLVIGYFLSMILSIIPKTSIIPSYIGALASFVLYLCVVDIAAAVAPRKRVLVAIIVGLLFSTFPIFLGYFYLTGIYLQQIEHDWEDTQNLIILTLACISAIGGIIMGVFITKSRAKPKKDNILIN